MEPLSRPELYELILVSTGRADHYHIDDEAEKRFDLEMDRVGKMLEK
jgi:hypothetical protein